MLALLCWHITAMTELLKHPKAWTAAAIACVLHINLRQFTSGLCSAPASSIDPPRSSQAISRILATSLFPILTGPFVVNCSFREFSASASSCSRLIPTALSVLGTPSSRRYTSSRSPTSVASDTSDPPPPPSRRPLLAGEPLDTVVYGPHARAEPVLVRHGDG